VTSTDRAANIWTNAPLPRRGKYPQGTNVCSTLYEAQQKGFRQKHQPGETFFTLRDGTIEMMMMMMMMILMINRKGLQLR
jgi:hypothetical protein